MHASSSSGRKSERWPTAPSRAFHANRSILTNHQVSVKDRLTFFHAVVTPVACFAAGHRKIFKQELAALDVAHRKLLRRVVGPPAGMDWSRPWYEILHDWNVRVSIFVGQAGLKPWSHTCLEQHCFCHKIWIINQRGSKYSLRFGR